jgi:outer membrane protein assembly factor BamB
VVTPLVAVIIGMSLDAVDLVAPEPLGGTSARYIPPDGHRSVTVAFDGVETITEHSRSIGVEGVFDAPMSIAGGLIERLGDTAVREAQWWRASRVSGGGDRTTDLYRVSEVGIAQVASWGGPIGFVFEPEIVLLPAEVARGDTWASSGSALADGALTYTMESVARDAIGPFLDLDGREVPLTGGCIGVESSLQIVSTVDEFSTVLDESTVWCPGRGQVWTSGTADAQPVGQAEVRPGAVIAQTSPEEPVPLWRDGVDTAARLSGGGAVELTIEDPFFGPSDASGQFWVPPVATPDGALVTANDRGNEVQAWRLGATTGELEWAGHPGGTIVSLGTVDELVVASTSRRQVVAYDSAGRRLWTWPVDELVLAPPVALGEEGTGVVVAARSGTVTVLDVREGVPRWSVSIGADARAVTSTSDGMVLVADERERVTALDRETGATLWRRDVGLVDVMQASAREGLVVVMTESGDVIALDLDSGVERFSTVYLGAAQGVGYAPGAVIVVSDESAVALEVGGGAQRWRVPGGDALLGEGEVIAIARQDAIVLRATHDGALVDERPITVGSASSSAQLLAVGTVILRLGSDGSLQVWSVQ